VGRRPYFPLFLLGGGLDSSYRFWFRLFGFKLPHRCFFFSPFLPLNCLHSTPVPLLRCLSNRINCALAHPSLSLLCHNLTLHVLEFSEDGPPCTRMRMPSSFDHSPEFFIFV